MAVGLYMMRYGGSGVMNVPTTVVMNGERGAISLNDYTVNYNASRNLEILTAL